MQPLTPLDISDGSRGEKERFGTQVYLAGQAHIGRDLRQMGGFWMEIATEPARNSGLVDIQVGSQCLFDPMLSILKQILQIVPEKVGAMPLNETLEA
jgi:hypothetical protein